MPKGTSRPDNRAEKMILKGMKKARKSGAGKRQHLYPGAGGTASGVGTFSVEPSTRQRVRGVRETQKYIANPKSTGPDKGRKGPRRKK